MRFMILVLAMMLSGCANHPVLRNTLIGVGAALVAGQRHDEQATTHPDVQLHLPSCANGECR